MILSEFLMVLILQPGWIGLPDTTDKQLQHFVTMWTYLLIASSIIALMRWYRFDVRKLVPSNQLNRYLSILLIVGCVEFVLVALVTYRSYLAYQYPASFPLSFSSGVYLDVALIIYVFLVLVFARYLSLSKRHVQTETETPFLKNLDGMLSALQHMREENNRGFQTLLALMEAGKTEEALTYTKRVNEGRETDIRKIEGINNPAVASLLSAKAAICLAQRIAFTVDVQSSRQLANMKSFEVIQLLGNLLDNAIRAAAEAVGERYVRFSWAEDEREEVLTIENNGPTIPREKLEQIFQMGFTTKRHGEGGLGLAIVKRVVNRYKGRIDVQSADGVTVFRISCAK